MHACIIYSEYPGTYPSMAKPTRFWYPVSLECAGYAGTYPRMTKITSWYPGTPECAGYPGYLPEYGQTNKVLVPG